jgi:hypothetical protein
LLINNIYLHTKPETFAETFVDTFVISSAVDIKAKASLGGGFGKLEDQ